MYGFFGKVAYVDLSSRKFNVREFKEDYFKMYLGGVGIATEIIANNVGWDVNPLSPDNILVFAVGSFQGTTIPGSGRWTVASRSPLTGIYADSNAGGNWGPEFKRSGFDALVVVGKANKPVYLWIHDGEVEFKDASTIWGKQTSETDKEVKKDIGEANAKVACIGPAGENLVKFACIVNEHGFAGRCGLGAVMGSKNLKAIAVQGTKTVEVFKPDELNEYSKEMFEKIGRKQGVEGKWRKYGTQPFAKIFHDVRGYGLAKNWREGTFNNIDKIDGEHFQDIVVEPLACTFCPVACHKHTRVKEPEKYAYDGHGPEYETIAMIGWLNEIDDVKAIGYIGHLCNEYGIDTITTGSIIGFVTECYEKGWVTKDELGFDIGWNKPDSAIMLINKIVKKEGFGKILAEGVKSAAEYIGKDAFKIILHSKGLDYPAHDPRAFYPMLINYATGPRGACHQRGFAAWHPAGILIPEFGIDKETDPYDMKDAAIIAVKYQDWATIFNCLIQCEFLAFGGLTLTSQIKFLNLITGWGIDIAKVSEIAERVFTLQRLINIRFGISKKDDYLIPQRMHEPLKTGKSAGKVPIPFEKALETYYKLRGWDEEGKPSKEKLEKLGLISNIKN